MSIKRKRIVTAVCTVLIAIAVCLCLSGCRYDHKKQRPTVKEVDQLFADNLSLFGDAAIILYTKPQFYEWYHGKYGWHDIQASRLYKYRSDEEERKLYIEDDEWELIETLFDKYQITGIHMSGDGDPIEFYWTTCERHTEGDLICISYLYKPSPSDISSADTVFGIETPIEFMNWHRIVR